MSTELFGKTRSECAEWLAKKCFTALLTTYRLPFATWEQATPEQRAYCRRVALDGIQEADTHLTAWGGLRPDESSAPVTILSVEPVPPSAPSYQPSPEYRMYRVTFSDGRHGDVSSPWLVRCANGWMQNHQAVSAQIIYDKDKPDIARLINLDVAHHRVKPDLAVQS